METHKVLDLIYAEEEEQECFRGTYQECVEYCEEQGMSFTYEIMELMIDERIN